ncbi:MAG TPA: hypothetical protein VGM82_22745 [Gemmatimonadaceae bacterium]|jgi:hypothetical protein
MTCDIARDALLDVDLTIRDHSSKLGRHLLECDACARIADALVRDVTSLRIAVRRRARKRRQIATAAAISTLAATAVFAFVHVNRPTGSTLEAAPLTVNAAPAGVVSVQVPPGKTAIVLRTTDPKVTVLWLSNSTGGGL